MNSLLQMWDAVLASVAVIIIVVIALGLIIRVIEPPSAFRRIVATLGCMVILIMIPPIILHLWFSLSPWQQIGIVALLGFAIVVTLSRRHASSRKRSPSH